MERLVRHVEIRERVCSLSGRLRLEVTPPLPAVLCPREASKIVARKSSKKSGSRFSEATDATPANGLNIRCGIAGGSEPDQKFPPSLAEARRDVNPLLACTVCDCGSSNIRS